MHTYNDVRCIGDYTRRTADIFVGEVVDPLPNPFTRISQSTTDGWLILDSQENVVEASNHDPVHRSMISASGAYRGDISNGVSSGTTEDWPPSIESY